VHEPEIPYTEKMASNLAEIEENFDGAVLSIDQRVIKDYMTQFQGPTAWFRITAYTDGEIEYVEFHHSDHDFPLRLNDEEAARFLLAVGT
jgi:hypothetical protein